VNVPYRWLRDIVPVELPPRDLAQRLTMAGLEAEKLQEIGALWSNVYIGEVLSVVPHPDADRLVLADVAAGDHRLTVVTGAPNIAQGQKVALALAGARLVDAYADEYKLKTLKPGKIRGIESQGMVCSEKELGLSDEHEGILVLEPDAPAGAALADWLGDSVIEFEITPNRVDAFSIVGIARDVSALTGQPVHVPASADLTEFPTSDAIISVANDINLPRYSAAIIDGLRVEPSPAWMQRRLTAAGVRPISNLVDITNYVMLELGQPMHAFDLRLFPDQHVHVRAARAGETTTTLDHVERSLPEGAVLITNGHDIVGLGGVIGGLNSEIVDDTTSILLESATFDMTTIRATSRALKVRTDASARYERGLDPGLAIAAQARAINLLFELCPGARVRAWQDVYPRPVESRTISFPVATVQRLLGMDIPVTRMLNVLTALQFSPAFDEAKGELSVLVPTWRPDVLRKQDVIEEIARIVGYDALPATLITGTNPPVERDPLYLFERDIRRQLTASGVSEARTYITVTDTAFRHWSGERRPVRLVNPINAEEGNLRASALPRLIETVVQNLKHEPGVRLFEIGHVFLANDPDSLPEEPSILALAFAGQRAPFDRFNPRPDATQEMDYFDVKGILDGILARHSVPDLEIRRAEHPMLHPGRSADITSGSQRLGFIGEVRPDRAEEFGIPGSRLVVAELDLTALLALRTGGTGRTLTVDRYLPAEQDFAVVVPKDTPAATVQAALEAGAGPLATGVVLFDIFEGAQLGEGNKSLAFRVTFTAPDRAITDAELGKVRNRIAKALQQRVGGQLRA
jgi:phenylalanyl-tRNA synthetase beta chain